MSDEQTIEAIKKRNVERRDAVIERFEMGDYDPLLDVASQDIAWLLTMVEARDAMIAAWEKAMAWEKQHPSGGAPCEVCARLGPKEHRES